VPEILVDNVSFVYRSPYFPEHRALEGVSLRIGAGELIAVVGASGSGKTTLIQHLNGILRPSSGRILVDGSDLADPKTDLYAMRSRVGLVYQFPESQLFEETVYRDVAFGPRHMRLASSDIHVRVRRAMDLVGLDFDLYRDQSPFHLSGGEMRRTAIAGVLAMEPETLVLDEPTAGLDWESGRRIESLLLDLHASGRTVVFVSHDMDLVARLALRVVVMAGGKKVFDEAPDLLFRERSLVESAGLELPQVTATLIAFKEKGLPVRTDIYTLDAAMEEIRRVTAGKVKRNN
jgi:energy-coupling factor transport system ATP-binding protein